MKLLGRNHIIISVITFVILFLMNYLGNQEADKLERVAKNSPSARNGVQAAEARNAANNANIRNEAAGTATTETTESTINKKTSNLSLSSGGNGGGYNPNAPRQDNTYTKKPVLLPIHQ